MTMMREKSWWRSWMSPGGVGSVAAAVGAAAASVC